MNSPLGSEPKEILQQKVFLSFVLTFFVFKTSDLGRELEGLGVGTWSFMEKVVFVMFPYVWNPMSDTTGISYLISYIMFQVFSLTFVWGGVKAGSHTIKTWHFMKNSCTQKKRYIGFSMISQASSSDICRRVQHHICWADLNHHEFWGMVAQNSKCPEIYL